MDFLVDYYLNSNFAKNDFDFDKGCTFYGKGDSN